MLKTNTTPHRLKQFAAHTPLWHASFPKFDIKRESFFWMRKVFKVIGHLDSSYSLEASITPSVFHLVYLTCQLNVM